MVINYDEYLEKYKRLVAKPQPPKPAEPTPSEAVREEIKGEGIAKPKLIPKDI